jgi:hypothetical protein
MKPSTERCCTLRQIGFDAFLTVDDKLSRRAKRFSRRLGVRAIDPVSFLRELEDDADG